MPVRRSAPIVLIAIGTVLAIHAALIVSNLHLDGDTLAEVVACTHIKNFSDVVLHRRSEVFQYLAQSPILWISNTAISYVIPDWNTLFTTRLISIISITLVVVLLVVMVRGVGGTLPMQVLVVAFPFCWHGFSFLVAECDDNVSTDALRLALVLSLFYLIGLMRRPWSYVTPKHCLIGTGLLLGAAISWHFQSVLLILPVVVIVWFCDRKLSALPRMHNCAIALTAALCVYLAWCALPIFFGIANVAPLDKLPQYLFFHHHKGSNDWFFASGQSWQDHLQRIWEGWGRMVLGYGWLRPGGLIGILCLVAPATLIVLSMGVSLAILWRTRGFLVLGVVLGVQIAHSVFYEPESIERWDMVAMLSGLLGALAITKVRRQKQWRAARMLTGLWGATAAVLLILNVWGWWRFATLAEPLFLNTANGVRTIETLTVDSIGAHYRLSRAASKFSANIGDDDAFLGVLVGLTGEERVLSWLTKHLGRYLSIYEPNFDKRKGSNGYAIAFFNIVPTTYKMSVVSQEGFVFLLRP